LQVQFESLVPASRLSPDVETSLYRIVQEALNNVIRHAKATRVDVLLEHREGRLSLMVEDDGIGFDWPAASNNGRLGLFGMRERVDMLGGRLIIVSVRGQGTVVKVEVPCVLQEDTHR
jgi:signal transduction histidine kinase